MAQHKHADILRMLAADDTLKVERREGDDWVTVNPATVLGFPEASYRVVGVTLSINGRQFPKPTSEGPYRVRVLWGSEKGGKSGGEDFEHRTYQAAQDHFNAIVVASRGG